MARASGATRKPTASATRRARPRNSRRCKREFFIAAALTAPLLLQMVPMLAAGGLFGAAHADLLPRWLQLAARHARPVLDRPPVLRRRVECAARRRREHGRADRAGHDDGLGVQRRGHRARPARPARLFRSGRGRHHAGAARQAAGGARQGRHVRGARRPAAAAAEDRARRARRRRRRAAWPTWWPAIASSCAPGESIPVDGIVATALRASTRAC